MAATPEGVENSSLPYSLQNLLRRAAEYFRQIRTKESAWTSIADLSPQLAEFDLLIEAGDDGTALEVFVGLGLYLERWGYRRQIVRMAAALAPRLTGTARAEIVATAGEAHYSLEEFDLAAMRYEEALSASDDGDVLARFRLMLCLANCRVALQENEAASRLFDVILRDSLKLTSPSMRPHSPVWRGSRCAATTPRPLSSWTFVPWTYTWARAAVKSRSWGNDTGHDCRHTE